MSTRLVFRTLEDRTQPATRGLSCLLATRHLVAGALPGPRARGGPFIVFEETAWLDMLAGARSDLFREQVGVLYGGAHEDGDQTWLHVTHAFHARAARGSRVHVDLDAPAWEDVHAQARSAGLDGNGSASAVVGWWHTHPDLGAFFSGTDRATQERAFPRAWQVGLVLDPVRREVARFCGGGSEPVLLRPAIVAPPAPARPDVPAEAVVLDLPPDAADLAGAAWEGLASCRAGALLRPLPHPCAAESCGLVFDRPALKRRHPIIAAALASSARSRAGWVLPPVRLHSRDVACVLARGLFRPTREVLPRSVP